MNNIRLLLSLSLLVSMSFMVAADKKENLSTATKKAEAVKEADVLKELETFPAAHVALMKAAFLARNNGPIEVYGQKHKFTFQKRIIAGNLEDLIRIESLLRRKKSPSILDVPLNTESKDIPDLSAFNEPINKVEEHLYNKGGWFYRVCETHDVCPKESCDKHEYRAWIGNSIFTTNEGVYEAVCGTVISKDLYEYLDKKLKENSKFLDDRINKK